jgi:hypothetical protein
MDLLVLGFVLLLLLIAAVSLVALHARPSSWIEKAADGDIDAQTLQMLALAGTAGAGAADCSSAGSCD